MRIALWIASAVIVALLVFFSVTFPANQATANWTVAPDNWSVLRRRWEYAHAGEALLYFAALIFLVVAGLSRRV